MTWSAMAGGGRSKGRYLPCKKVGEGAGEGVELDKFRYIPKQWSSVIAHHRQGIQGGPITLLLSETGCSPIAGWIRVDLTPCNPLPIDPLAIRPAQNANRPYNRSDDGKGIFDDLFQGER